VRDKYQHQVQKKIRAAATAAAAAASSSLDLALSTLSVQAPQQTPKAETCGAASGTLCVVAFPPAPEESASTSQDAGVDEGGPAAHDFSLPSSVSQDLEASARERAASLSPLNAEHHPMHVASFRGASFRVLVHKVASWVATGPLLSDALRSMAAGGSMQSQDSDHTATNPKQRALGGLEMSGVATAAEGSRAEAGSAAPGALAVGRERDEGHVTQSASQEDEGNGDDIAESTRENKDRKAEKKGGLASTAAHHLALPKAGWQDLEASTPQRAASPSPLTAQHYPQHILSPPALLLVVHGVPYI